MEREGKGASVELYLTDPVWFDVEAALKLVVDDSVLLGVTANALYA